MANATEIRFGDPATRVAQGTHWTVLVRPKQPALGSLVLVCREPARAFGDLTPQSYYELGTHVRLIEGMLRAFVAYERINYLMLMMVDPDVHFHVIPRYSVPRSFLGTPFPDAGWPGPPALDAAVTLDDAARGALVETLRRAWQQVAA